MCCESWERMKDVNVEGEEGREREPGGVNGWSEVKKESEMAWTPTKQNDTTNVTRRVGEWARVEEWVSECCWHVVCFIQNWNLGGLLHKLSEIYVHN